MLNWNNPPGKRKNNPDFRLVFSFTIFTSLIVFSVDLQSQGVSPAAEICDHPHFQRSALEVKREPN
jgi:hypothetical protein